jgi:hypothetical protein
MKYISYKEVVAFEILDIFGMEGSYRVVLVGAVSQDIRPSIFAHYFPVKGDFLITDEIGNKSVLPREKFFERYKPKEQATAPVDGSKVNVTVEGDHAFIKVRINGLLHLSILRNDLFSIQAWHDETLWKIECVSKAGVKIRTDYTSRDLWAAVLGGLDKIAITLE